MFISTYGDLSEDDTDDAVQDIFVRLVDVLRTATYRPEKGHFRAYLRTMVRRLLIDLHRRALVRGSGNTISAEDMELLAETPDAATCVDMRLQAARHVAAVEHVLSRTILDPRTVAAYRAYALDGEPAAEVAVRLGLTLKALHQIKYRVNRMIAAVESAYGE